MYGKIKEHLQRELAEIEAAGLYKKERVITSPPTTTWGSPTTSA